MSPSDIHIDVGSSVVSILVMDSDSERNYVNSLLSLLKLHLVVSVGEGEDPQLAVTPRRALGYNVRQKDGQTTIIVQPPHVQRAWLLPTEQNFSPVVLLGLVAKVKYWTNIY